MKYEIPKTFMGKPVAGAMKRVLEGNTSPQNNPVPVPSFHIITNISNLEDYIFLQGKTHGTYSYPDLLVSKYRLGMSPEVEQAASEFGYSLANSGRERHKRDFIGNINWEQALKLNLGLGGGTLNPRQFEDFLLLLKSGDALDGTGRKIGRNELDEILDEITTVRSPYRAEWLDADFKYLDRLAVGVTIPDDKAGKLWLYSDHRLDSNRTLDANYKKELESCLMTKGSKINLSTMNDQGMPTQEGNDFQYWCPDKDNKSVAWFVAYSGRAVLNCYWYPTNTNSSLGVRHVREAHAQN